MAASHSSIIADITKELHKHISVAHKEGAQRFFKEPIRVLGVPTPIVRKISATFFQQVKYLPKKEVFALCEELFTKESEYLTIGFDWAYRIRKQYTKEDFTRFEQWVKKYVSNWSSCDDFCTHALGAFLFEFPEYIPQVKKWARSKSRWLKRASAVVFIYSVRRGQHLQHAFDIADTLLQDPDDLVQKGYGWMLKEATKKHQQKVFEYVIANASKMPRTALRYAIEKLPPKMKAQAMKA